LGIYNWRGEMLWLVDLEEMLGYTPLLKDSNTLAKMMAIVLENEGQYLGLLVRQLMDIEWLDTNEMKAPYPELFYPALSPFLDGYFIKNYQEILFNLNALSIIKSSMWDIHN
jgi:positive phototaxis protein PixI